MVSYTLVAHKLLVCGKLLILKRKISTLLLSGSELELLDGVRFCNRLETQAFFWPCEILDVGGASLQSGPKRRAVCFAKQKNVTDTTTL